jgi:hypothetical protein
VKRYGKEGFTRKVLEELREGSSRWIEIGEYHRCTATAEALLRAAALLPKANLSDRQNEAPRLRDFLEVARGEPRALFEAYVIDWARDDERLTVDGALIPADRQDLIAFLRKKAKAEPDEFGEVEVGGLKHVRMWWD